MRGERYYFNQIMEELIKKENKVKGDYDKYTIRYQTYLITELIVEQFLQTIPECGKKMSSKRNKKQEKTNDNNLHFLLQHKHW